jgi:WD40 repeat protein
MLKRSQIVVLVGLHTLAVTPAPAGDLRKIWQTSIHDWTGLSGSDFGVFALSFSPDGQKIAAVVGRSWHEEVLFIINVSAPQANLGHIEINPKIRVTDTLGGIRRLSWSPSGRSIILGNTIVQVSSGESCVLPEISQRHGFFFAADDAVVGQEFKPNRLSFFGLDCRGSGSWEPPPPDSSAILDLDIMDTSAERHLVVFFEKLPFRGGDRADVLVMDSNTRTVLKRSPLMTWGLTFGDGGKAICGIAGRPWNVEVHCADSDTGEELGKTKEWTDLDLQTALHASRVVASDYGRKLDWFVDWFWYRGSLKRRTIWDFRTSKEIVAWRPKTQAVLLSYFPLRPREEREPFPVAISPDGNYVVEGGAGTLILSTVEP